MSVGHNARLSQFLDLLARGEVHRARQGCTTQEEWAARLGMSIGTFRGVQRRARELGHAVPGWGDAVDDRFDASEFDEEPTRPNVRVPDEVIRFSDNSEPPLPPIPPGHRVRGQSTLVRPDGSIAAQWIKTAANQNEIDAWMSAVRSVGPDVPRSPLSTRPESTNDRLLAGYFMGDPHIGLICDALTSGEDFDTEVAERNLFTAVDDLVSVAPSADTALMVDLGDGLTIDTLAGTTTAGTKQDADVWERVFRVGLRLRRRLIGRILEKHGRVHVALVRGNHDKQSALATSYALAAMFENDPRVCVELSPRTLNCFRFGVNLFGWHHGHAIKGEALPLRLATDFPEEWGAAKHRRIITGHVHHETVKEHPGVTVKTVNTLAPSDRYHHEHGYRAKRFMDLEVFDIDDGLIRTNRIGIEAIRRKVAAVANACEA